MEFNISIIGIGLMGGSLAYALKGFRGCKITGFDINSQTGQKALGAKAIDRLASSIEQAVEDADITIFCISPSAIDESMKRCAAYFQQGSLVTEICGIKHNVSRSIRQMLPPGVSYAGLHPMAGKEVGGFENADDKIFHGAGFILTTDDEERDASALAMLRELSAYLGAGRIEVNSPIEHDRLIAYSSHLMHIAAAAACISYPENLTTAHLGGAFRDVTRIATIDAGMWTELIFSNSEAVAEQLDCYIDSLAKFASALKAGDESFALSFFESATANKAVILES
ncbi:MAG: prephenate dehydrogenase [Eubacteriaceae bacterium]|nr:prephenate dehydrogenase [Eubacteriaceae bacterium]